jgi:RNA polymerase sigma-70 factor, ECF subfamily
MAAQQEDLELMARLRSGDANAMGELYDRYTPLLYPVVHRIVKNAPDAEDALQEAWLQAWRASGAYDPARGSVAAWLLTIARSRALDRVRSAASRRRAESQADAEPPPPSDDPSASPARRQISEQVRNALETLDARHRRVLECAYFDGLSQSEIAKRLEAPLGTVKSWTRQALGRLRDLLPGEEWT